MGWSPLGFTNRADLKAHYFSPQEIKMSKGIIEVACDVINDMMDYKTEYEEAISGYSYEVAEYIEGIVEAHDCESVEQYVSMKVEQENN